MPKRITKTQQKILDEFICERLSSNPINEDAMRSFNSELGKSLVSYCRVNGFKEDDIGETAYYIIKTKSGEPLMFFSLKCGALFETLQEESQLLENKQNLLVLLQALQNVSENGDEAGKALELLVKNDIKDAESILALIEKAQKKNDVLNALSSDKQKEENENIHRVERTHPSVELVHFCTNDNMKPYWKSLNMPHTMGETLFWNFIALKFFEVQDITGCEYAFLFAADLSEEGTLLNYYEVSLKFGRKMDFGTSKPFYDFGCVFVCQEINAMKEARKEFFENFNVDNDDDLI